MFAIFQTRTAKVLWSGIVCLSFIVAGILIGKSYKDWQESPIATSITTHPIGNLNFPVVTICPPKDSNTALYPDLMRADNGSLTEDDRKSLQSSIREIVKISALEFSDNMLAATNPTNLEKTYLGHQSVPKTNGPNGFEIKVGGIEGSIKSPRFGNVYSENHYKMDRSAHVVLDLNDVIEQIGSGTLVLEMEVDTRQEEGWREEVEYQEGSRFKVFGDGVLQGKSWIDAEAHCKTLGGQLASVLSEEEQNEFESLEIRTEYLEGKAATKKSTFAWTGARQEEKNGEWLWTNGIKLSKDWKYESAMRWDNPPFCMMVSTAMKWYQKVCDAPTKYPFVCKFPPQTVSGKKKLQLAFSEDDIAGVSMTSSGGFSSFHVRYKYQAASQELLDSWEDKRMTGFNLSWRIETHLFQFEETQIGKELQISGLGDTSLANRDYSHKITLEMPSNLEELIGGDRLLKIEIEAGVGRENG